MRIRLLIRVAIVALGALYGPQTGAAQPGGPIPPESPSNAPIAVQWTGRRDYREVQIAWVQPVGAPRAEIWKLRGHQLFVMAVADVPPGSRQAVLPDAGPMDYWQAHLSGDQYVVLFETAAGETLGRTQWGFPQMLRHMPQVAAP